MGATGQKHRPRIEVGKDVVEKEEHRDEAGVIGTCEEEGRRACAKKDADAPMPANRWRGRQKTR